MNSSEMAVAEFYEGGSVDNILGEISYLVAVSGDWVVDVGGTGEEIVVVNGGHLELRKAVYLISPVMTGLFCYIDEEEHGQYFRGYQKVDREGRKCLTPCRNEEKASEGPTCLVNVNGTQQPSVCGVPKCVWNVACYAQDGVGYRGNQTTGTQSGETYTCQNWSRDFPHPHMYHPSPSNTAVYGIGQHNKCRNPDPRNSGQPWCYTTSILVRYVYCSEILHCEDTDLPVFHF